MSLFFLIIIFYSSCTNNIEVIKNLTDIKNRPSLHGLKVEIIYSDSAVIQAKVEAPELKKFEITENPYLEFPKGIHIIHYKPDMTVESDVKAKYAKYFERDQLWQAKNDVIVTNTNKGEQLNTEELFWDEKKEILYSNVFTRIINASGVHYGNKGFEADQYMTKYKLKGAGGTITQ